MVTIVGVVVVSGEMVEILVAVVNLMVPTMPVPFVGTGVVVNQRRVALVGIIPFVIGLVGFP